MVTVFWVCSNRVWFDSRQFDSRARVCDDSGGGSGDAAIEAAKEQCRQAIDSNPAVSADLKSDLLKELERD